MAGVGASTNCRITDLPFSLTPSTNTHVHVSRGSITSQRGMSKAVLGPEVSISWLWFKCGHAARTALPGVISLITHFIEFQIERQFPGGADGDTNILFPT